MIKLFKGDDTGGTLGKSVVITLTTEHDLTGCTVVFNYQGVERRWSDVVSGSSLSVFFSHNETAKMSVGVFKAVIYAIDSAGKIRTITNSLPIKVSTNIAECYDNNAVTVALTGAINWESIIGKPFTGQTVDLTTDDDIRAALGTIIEHLGGQIS